MDDKYLILQKENKRFFWGFFVRKKSWRGKLEGIGIKRWKPSVGLPNQKYS